MGFPKQRLKKIILQALVVHLIFFSNWALCGSNLQISDKTGSTSQKNLPVKQQTTILKAKKVNLLAKTRKATANKQIIQPTITKIDSTKK